MKKRHNSKSKDTGAATSATGVDTAAMTDLEKASLSLLETVAQTEQEMQAYYIEITDAPPTEELNHEVEQKIRSFKSATSNIQKAYQQSFGIRDELSGRWSDLKKSRKKRKIIPGAPPNAVIDLEENESYHFAQGLNLYKLLWLCYIGSFVGVVIELLWCLLTKGYLESRSGLVYGPFNLLYGVGAVALSVSLYKYRNHEKWLSFIGGMLVGSIVEYVCSWGQELVFGSRSWDYSEMPFNLNGRICLLYSVFWGLLGVLWVKSLYPRMAQLIMKIPNRAGKILTWLFLAFFIVNALVSVVAIYRWSQRLSGLFPSNAFWQFIDVRFPDSRMERIFANMEF